MKRQPSFYGKAHKRQIEQAITSLPNLINTSDSGVLLITACKYSHDANMIRIDGAIAETNDIDKDGYGTI
eukprot:scaffold2229_cov255-Amphora_coffeaeformis.AAC.4